MCRSCVSLCLFVLIVCEHVFTRYCADYITPANCTVEAITPIVANIKVALNDGIVKLKDLYGQPAEVILAAVDASAVVSVSVLAQLVADLVIVSIDCLRFTEQSTNSIFSSSSAVSRSSST